jgi:O-antigen/teichoic acid export membrane protein
MGLLSELMLVNEYSKSHHLGVLNALDREIPYYRGKGDTSKVEEVKRTSLNFSLATALLACLVIFAISFYLKIINFDRDFINGLFLVALLIVVEIITSYYRAILRTSNRFTFLSKFNIFFAIVETASTVSLIILFGYKGALLALIFTGIIAAFYLFNFSGLRIKFGFRFRFKKAVELLKVGFPLHLYELIRTLFLTVDRLIIIVLLGRTSLGLYSIATMAYNFLTPLPRGIYNVLFPKFYEAYGKTQDIEKVKHYLLKPTMIFAYLFPLLIGVGSTILPLIVEYILPKYKEGLMPAHIFIFSTFFYSLIFMWQSFLIALYKQIKIVQFNLMAVVICIGLNYLFVKTFNMGLNGIALGTTLSHFILSAIVITYVFYFYTKKVQEHISLCLKLYFPILWVFGILFVFRYLFNYRYISLSGDLLRALIFNIVLVLCCMPLLYYINKKTDVLTLILETIRKPKGG